MNKDLEKFFTKIDSFLCSYLGLNNSYSKPVEVEIISNNLFISNTESNKRHLQKNLFQNINVFDYSSDDRKKLGKAIAKTLATDLVITFD